MHGYEIDGCLLLYSNEPVILADAGPGVQVMGERAYVCDDSFIGSHIMVPVQEYMLDEMLWLKVGNDVVFSSPIQPLMWAWDRALDLARASVRVRRPIVIPPRQPIHVTTSKQSRIKIFLRGIRKVADTRFLASGGAAIRARVR